MSSEDELRIFVREALARGLEPDEVARSLTDAGWSPAQVREALSTFAGTLAGVPVPRPRASSGTRDAFIYGGMFASLFFTAWAFGAIAFYLIDITLTDENTPGLLRELRWPLSVSIVSTPVFVLINRLVSRETTADPNRRLSDIRRKLTYLTLFISAFVLLGTTATLIYEVLGGDPALAFVLKALVVAGISGTGFLHYLREMRADERAAGDG